MDKARVRHLEALSAELQSRSASKLELLTTDLFGRLVGVPVARSKSGFQFGGDAGTAGRQDRLLRFECKRYAESSPLSDRELDGEIKAAGRRAPHLEAWVLVSTKSVSENTQQTLHLAAMEEGIPVLVYDWTESGTGVPDLAALCAWAPDLVERHYGKKAGRSAAALSGHVKSVVDRIAKELQSWHLGYGELRRLARQRLQSIWDSDIQSRALFGQNAALTATKAHVSRLTSLGQLAKWWADESSAIAVIHGREGVGKTWAAMDWLANTAEADLPITLALPASSLLSLEGISEAKAIEFIASEFYELARSQDRRFWERRVSRLMARPLEEGPTLLLLIDGLNQEPLFEWRRLLQVMQGGLFSGRTRVIITIQSSFLDDELQGFKYLARLPTRIGIEPYDIGVGGELDRMLDQYGCTRAEFSAELLELARLPRLLPLVVKLRNDAPMHGEPTVSMLLYAYGRDDLSMREGRAFTEADWEQLLVKLAAEQLAHIEAASAQGALLELPRVEYSRGQLGGVAAESYATASVNYRRLTEIIDGTWMEAVPGSNTLRPRESTIRLALAAELIARLERSAALSPDAVDGELSRWLDPISATSAAADVLAAAMSIVVAKRGAGAPAVPTAILSALLLSQNVAEVHRREVKALATALSEPLLNLVEKSHSRSQASARRWAVEALQTVPEANELAWTGIHRCMLRWIARVDCPSKTRRRAENDDYEKSVSKRLTERIGTDEEGKHQVLGVSVQLQPRQATNPSSLIPSLLSGRPLLPAIPMLVAAAVCASITSGGHDDWAGLRWAVLLNSRDWSETIASLERLSNTALSVAQEPGLHPELRQRVSALLLWLTGVEENEGKANGRRVAFEMDYPYEREYLSDPVRSFYALERRHAELALGNEQTAIVTRLQRAATYLPQPDLIAPASLLHALEVSAGRFDMGQLDRTGSQTSEDLTFREFVPGAARFAPSALAAMGRRFLLGLAERTGEARHWGAKRAPEFLLLAGPEEIPSVAKLRINKPSPPDREEWFLCSQLLKVELAQKTALEQLNCLVEEPLTHLDERLLQVLRPASSLELEEFLRRWGSSNPHALLVLFNYLAQIGTALTQGLFDAVVGYALDGDDELRAIAFIALATSNPVEFGLRLLGRQWAVQPDQSIFEQDYGSMAVVAAAECLLEDLRFTIAPWHILKEARRRGSKPSDAKLAAAALGPAIVAVAFQPTDLQAQLAVDTTKERGRIMVRLRSEPGDDEVENFVEALDSTAQRKRHEAAHDEIHRYLTKAREAGAVLSTLSFCAEDARMLTELCTAEIDAWLQGMDAGTPAFVDKVNRAGGLFVAICEALLESDPPRGVRLWYALSSVIRTKFLGIAGINELVHMPFRVAPSSPVMKLRDDLYSLRRNPTDKDYLELVLCATVNGQGDWLRQKIERDLMSTQMWRQMRAVLLGGFAGEQTVDQAHWEEGPVIGSWGALRRRAMLWTNRHGQARHWWRAFLTSDTPSAAFAAWHVFLACVDRRAWSWMQSELDSLKGDDDLWRLKMLHFQINHSDLEAAMRAKEEKGSRNLQQTLLCVELPAKWLNASQLPSV